MTMTRERRLLIEQDGAGALERLTCQKLSDLYHQCTSTRDKVIVLNALKALEEAVECWRRERGL
jgi:hypothetical protein